MSKKQATSDSDLKDLECLFTWDVDKDDINDLKGIPEKLEDRVKYCPRRYHATYFNILAFVSHLQGKNKAAIAYLEKSLAVLEEEQRDEADFLVTYSSFAWLHHHQGNLEAMDTYLGKLRSIDEGREVVAEEEKGWSFLRLGSKFYPRSRESFEKVLIAKPDSLPCNVGYAVVLYRQEEMVRTDEPIKPEDSAAAQQLKKALELDPTDAELMVLLALKLQRFQPDESRELIRKAVNQSADIPQVTRYAATYFRRACSAQESLQVLEGLSQRAPNSSFVYHQMGLCHWQIMINMKKHGGQRAGNVQQVNAAISEIVRLFSKTVELKPSNTYAWVHLAEAYSESQQLRQAEPIFTRLLSDNALSDAERQHCHTKYGLFLLFKKKDDDKAIEQLKKAYAIRIDSKDRTKARDRLQKLASRRSGWRNHQKDILDFISLVDSPSHDKALKTKLLNVECHFTWALTKENVDLSDLQTRLEDQIELDLGKKEGAARSHCFLAYVRYLQGSSDNAIANLVQSEELAREHHGEDCEQFLIVTYGNYAWLHYHRGEYRQCESFLEKLADIMQKFPTGSPTVLHPQVYGEKGWTFLTFSRKYYDRAKECFKRALELEPDSSEWNAGYAIALYHTEYETEGVEDSETVKQLRRAIEINPQDAVLRVLLGLRLNVLKQECEESEKLVEDALEMDPSNPHVIRYVGKYFRHNGSVDRSIALLKRAVERTQDSAFLHHQLALCYKRKKSDLFRIAGGKGKGCEISQLICQIIYHLEQATTLKANFIFAMADLALHYGESNDMARAEEMFQATFDAARANREPLQVIHLYYAQFQQYCIKCETLAIKHYKDCLTLGPATYVGKQSASRLKKMAETRLDRDRRDAEAFGILGFVHKAKGEKRQALECFEKAMEIDCSNDEYLSAHCELCLSLQDDTQCSCEYCADVPDTRQWKQVEPMVSTEKSISTYSLSSAAGSYECLESSLRWSCVVPVNLQYRFMDWQIFDEELTHMHCRPVGPLMDIKLMSGELEEIHLPHFLCLGGSQAALKDGVKVLHQQNGGVCLEMCELSRSHARLLNPSFSILGDVVQYVMSFLPLEKEENKMEIHTDVHVYKSSIPLIFRMYLMPMDTHLKRLVEEQEKGFGGIRLLKPRPVECLQLNQLYALHTDCHSTILPPKLKLEMARNHLDTIPNFFEVHTEKNGDFRITLFGSADSPEVKKEVWQAQILGTECWTLDQVTAQFSSRGPISTLPCGAEPVDTHTAVDQATDCQDFRAPECATRVRQDTMDVADFLKRKMPDLIQRVTNVMQLADEMLSKDLITAEQYREIKAETTDQSKMRYIFDYLCSCGPPQKKKFLGILQDLHPSLLQELGWH